MKLFEQCRDYYLRRRQWNTVKVDPWRFEENNKKYYFCCGFFHVKSIVIAFTFLKSICILWFLIFQFAYRRSAMITIVSCFAYVLVLGSYALLLIGVIAKRYTFFIPYFTICVMLILSLNLKLFIELMGTASSKSTLNDDTLSRILYQAAVILIEIYSVFIVWETFNYVTDFYMAKDFHNFTRITEQRKQKELDIEKGKERRRVRSELLKIRQNEPPRKPSFFEVITRLEERKKSALLIKQKELQKEPISENSSTSDEVK